MSKVKMWQWVMKDKYGVCYMSDYFHPSEDTINLENKSDTVVCKAEWTEIECEDWRVSNI